MHRALAGWLSERPWAASLFAAAFAFLSPQGLSPFAVVAGAVPVLLALRRAPQAGLVAASIGGAAAFGTLIGGGVPLVVATASVLLVFAAPLALGVLLKRTGSLNLCFQVGVLGIALVLLVVHVVLDDPGAVWERWLDLAVKSLADAGLELDGAEVVASLRDNMWGSYAALTLVTVLGALFLGRWWDTLVTSTGTFGREFRQLKLGFWLGLAMTITVILAIIGEFAVFDALAWVAVTALAFEGLAAAHRGRAGGRFGQTWLVLIYVLLIVPPTAFIMVAMLAGWGFMDNWRRTSWRAA
jgi:hypothetical protein